MRHLRYCLGLILLNLASQLSYASGLPPEHEANRLMLSVEQSIKEKNWLEAQADLDRIAKLQVELPKGYFFYSGKVSFMLDQLDAAQQDLENYVIKSGQKAPFYIEALKMITAIEEKAKEKEKLLQDSKPIPSDSQINWQPKPAKKIGYVESLKKLYLTDDGIKALLMQINSLLTDHSYQSGRVRTDQVRKGIVYKINVVKNELQVTETHYSTSGHPSMQMQKLNVYGVDPIIRYGCDYDQFQCWIFDPTDQITHWLIIDRNSEAASELAQALSSLIKLMQKS